MTQKKKPKKKSVETPMTASIDNGGASSSVRPLMTSDPFPQLPHADFKSGTASIPTVTDAMMDHAAHHVTEQVDTLAHGGPASDDPDMETAAETAAEAGEVAEEGALSTGEIVDEVVQHAAPISEASTAEVTQASDRVAATGSELVLQTLDASETVAAEVQETAASVERAAQASLSGAPNAFSRYNAKLFEMMQTNLAATSAHMTALLQARSVPDALALNAEHLRRQLDTMTAQGRELTTLAQRFTFDVLEPLKTVVGASR